MNGPLSDRSNRGIFTVSGLTAEIRSLLEERFPFVWVTGEISDRRLHTSGHLYFRLKDGKASISAVMFRGQNRRLTFRPENGMAVVALGRISVYEPRGDYQIILEYLEPKGAGALQVAFEQLKARLEAEGLFSADRKRPIPFLPRKIGVITSRTGAVFHDIINVLHRRYPAVPVLLIPVRVQGEGAAEEIVEAIGMAARREDLDVVILARGGGSLEDLMAFNSEAVARAVHGSALPVISAVGHETDFTIADFAADLRAPTPSAAAELAVPVRSELSARCDRLTAALVNRFRRFLEDRRRVLKAATGRIIHPRRRIEDGRLRLDDAVARMSRAMARSLERRRERLTWRVQRLESLSPLSILSRGYAVARSLPDLRVVGRINQVAEGQRMEVLLADGRLTCRVEEVLPNHDRQDREAEDL